MAVTAAAVSSSARDGDGVAADAVVESALGQLVELLAGLGVLDELLLGRSGSALREGLLGLLQATVGLLGPEERVALGAEGGADLAGAVGELTDSGRRHHLGGERALGDADPVERRRGLEAPQEIGVVGGLDE